VVRIRTSLTANFLESFVRAHPIASLHAVITLASTDARLACAASNFLPDRYVSSQKFCAQPLLERSNARAAQFLDSALNRLAIGQFDGQARTPFEATAFEHIAAIG
jgi:hypothetical protein